MAVQIAVGVILSMDVCVFEKLVSGLRPVTFSASTPVTDQIGSYILFGTSLATYQLNGNARLTEVSIAPA